MRHGLPGNLSYLNFKWGPGVLYVTVKFVYLTKMSARGIRGDGSTQSFPAGETMFPQVGGCLQWASFAFLLRGSFLCSCEVVTTESSGSPVRTHLVPCVLWVPFLSQTTHLWLFGRVSPTSHPDTNLLLFISCQPGTCTVPWRSGPEAIAFSG